MLAGRARSANAVVQHRSVTIEGERFHCFVWGASGPCVVLVHATGFHGYVWKPIAQGLSRDHHVFALDQRGHGDSFKPDVGYAWEVFGKDLFHFLTALRRRDIVAIGHSAGATAIALCAAAHPGLLRCAVLIDPILFPRSPAGQELENQLAHRAQKRRMVWESRNSMFHSYRTRPPFNTWREDVLWAYIEEGTALRPDGHIELKCPGAIEAQIYEHAPKLDGFAVLPRVDIPILLIRGESSAAFPEASATRALSLLPHCRLKTMAKTTHFVPMERPDAVERTVRRFMSPLGLR
jgi:pimeloyl-ACP methyl ester carboxylesterase